MDEDLSQLWMVPYADLMSTLVILFMSLFALSYSERSAEYQRALADIEAGMAPKEKSARARQRLEEAHLAVQLQEDLRGLALAEFGLKVTARQVRLSLPSPVLFAEGSASLSPAAARLLEPLSRLLSKVDNPILVEGHTDNVPIASGHYRTNWELSAARAFSVIDYFIAQRGLRPERFHARGFGEHRPVASNDDAIGRRRNRRIEISLIRELEPNP